MKVLGHGQNGQREHALRYSLGLAGVSLAIVGMKSIGEIDQNVAIAADFKPLTADEEQRLIAAVRPLIERDAEENETKGHSPLFWLHDTKVTGWESKDEPARVSY
jgi:predicted aldo/keto reductase-like oxidoreductase